MSTNYEAELAIINRDLQRDLATLRQQLADTRTELDAVLRDWNALVAASGSPTNGGAVGYVTGMRQQLADAQAKVAVLREAMRNLTRAHMVALENGRDRILELGGQCDPLETMEAGSPELQNARNALEETK